MTKKRYAFKMSIALVVFVMCLCMVKVEDVEAASKYYIKVNKRTNVATVYLTKTNKPYKAFLVSCGNATPTGTFYTPAKYRWRTLVGPVYGQYCTRITGSILFHSVWYYQNGKSNTLSYKEYNKLGTTCSHGCVRLNVESAKWIYDNCPLKTKVIIFNGTSKNDPLGRPYVKKVSTKQKMGWDPTDPNKSNPYNKISYSGVTTSTKTVEQGTKVKVLKGVSAKTQWGRNLTSKIKVTVKKPGQAKYASTKASTMTLTKAGTYTIVYNVTDAVTGLSKKVTVKYNTKAKKPTSTPKPTPTPKPDTDGVDKDDEKEDNIIDEGYEIRFEGIKESCDVEYMSELDIKTNIKVYNGADEDVSDTLEIRLKGPGMDDYSKFEGEMLLFDMVGEYTIYYKAWNPVEKKYIEEKVTYNSIEKSEGDSETEREENSETEGEESSEIEGEESSEAEEGDVNSEGGNSGLGEGDADSEGENSEIKEDAKPEEDGELEVKEE
ncbi:MAG: L,D-transpeptidase [Lachnospiraceae bacterium]|nr:L,D-transpeptidase [Lachnospiraceae bacterium]